MTRLSSIASVPTSAAHVRATTPAVVSLGASRSAFAGMSDRAIAIGADTMIAITLGKHYRLPEIRRRAAYIRHIPNAEPSSIRHIRRRSAINGEITSLIRLNLSLDPSTYEARSELSAVASRFGTFEPSAAVELIPDHKI